MSVTTAPFWYETEPSGAFTVNTASAVLTIYVGSVDVTVSMVVPEPLIVTALFFALTVATAVLLEAILYSPFVASISGMKAPLFSSS